MQSEPIRSCADTVYVYYKDRIVSLYRRWVSLIPRVQPYYAIKCNPDPYLLDVLADVGACFDAASPHEIDLALERVASSRIIYANPCKVKKDILYASSRGVGLTVFDSISEFDKVVQAADDMKLLFRIYANDPSAQCVLSNKYGATQDEWKMILQHVSTSQHRDKVVGVSFHIGSGANDPTAFTHAINSAKIVFEMAAELGITLSILDIGGGFTYKNIESMASSINLAIDDICATYDNTITVIAEPGRYFAETSADLYTKIISTKNKSNERHYWINDSLYGSFNCVMYDHAHPKPKALTLHQTPLVHSIVWGATCDGGDKICENTELPVMCVDDWLLWTNMGAYTQAGASHFNGIPFDKTDKVYV